MDLITYAPDLLALKAEGAAIAASDDGLSKLFSVDDNGDLTFNVTKIPVFYSGSETLCLVRGVDRETIESTSSIHILGECIDGEYVFDSESCRETYERVRGELEYEVDGVTYHRPYMIGVFL